MKSFFPYQIGRCEVKSSDAKGVEKWNSYIAGGSINWFSYFRGQFGSIF